MVPTPPGISVPLDVPVITGANKLLTLKLTLSRTFSTSARIYVVPVETPVTTPCWSTVAIVGLEVDQAIGRPLSGRPIASSGVAVSVTVSPGLTLGRAGANCIATTGTGTTVIETLDVTLSTVALIAALPGETPVTSPLLSTAATVAFEDE
jgi:hypothetical protein